MKRLERAARRTHQQADAAPIMAVACTMRDDGTLADPTPAQLERARRAHDALLAAGGFDYESAVSALAADG
jgi:hypothetical protein